MPKSHSVKAKNSVHARIIVVSVAVGHVRGIVDSVFVGFVFELASKVKFRASRSWRYNKDEATDPVADMLTGSNASVAKHPK